MGRRRPDEKGRSRRADFVAGGLFLAAAVIACSEGRLCAVCVALSPAFRGVSLLSPWPSTQAHSLAPITSRQDLLLSSSYPALILAIVAILSS